ncbi:hypothetical protein [Kibdelosporangium philippinense]|uniref:hypothetical protein n=1 Tax=Kibdelosporangium philippinense TaxID=211113 RepID=UPI003614BDD6
MRSSAERDAVVGGARHAVTGAAASLAPARACGPGTGQLGPCAGTAAVVPGGAASAAPARTTPRGNLNAAAYPTASYIQYPI